MKCKDCGAREYEPSDSRSDVCAVCMDLRMQLVMGVENGTISVEQFQTVQRSMNTDLFRHGRGARKMRQVLGQKES